MNRNFMIKKIALSLLFIILFASHFTYALDCPDGVLKCATDGEPNDISIEDCESINEVICFIDLMDPGDSTTVEDAIFYVPENPIESGTGQINEFLITRHNDSEEGFNTNASLPLDTQPGTQIVYIEEPPDLGGVKISDFVTIDNQEYFEFILDINELGKSPVIDLTGLQLYISTSDTISDLTSATKIWDMDASGDKTIQLDVNSAGSSGIDLVALFPTYLLTEVSGNYLVMYNEFTNSSDGFEEWAVRTPTFTNDYCIQYPDDPNCEGVIVVPIPEPNTLTLFIVGLIGMSYYRFRKQK